MGDFPLFQISTAVLAISTLFFMCKWLALRDKMRIMFNWAVTLKVGEWKPDRSDGSPRFHLIGKDGESHAVWY